MSTIVAATLVKPGGASSSPHRVLDAILPAIGINAGLCLMTAVFVGLFLRRRQALADA